MLTTAFSWSLRICFGDARLDLKKREISAVTAVIADCNAGQQRGVACRGQFVALVDNLTTNASLFLQLYSLYSRCGNTYTNLLPSTYFTSFVQQSAIKRARKRKMTTWVNSKRTIVFSFTQRISGIVTWQLTKMALVRRSFALLSRLRSPTLLGGYGEGKARLAHSVVLLKKLFIISGLDPRSFWLEDRRMLTVWPLDNKHDSPRPARQINTLWVCVMADKVAQH